jgi:hydroxymethylglutaryl-CoA synthase
MDKKLLQNVFIAGYGTYIPPFRVSTEEIAQAWGQDGKAVTNGLGVTKKAVAGADEDSVTMAVAAAQKALLMSGVKKEEIGAVFVGSESHPYAVKPTGTIVAEWLSLCPEYFCADLEFACKAGTAGLQIVSAMLEAGMIGAGLVIGVDKAQSRPGDALEYTAASAAAAYILTAKKGLAQIKATSSFCSDTPDFWRRQHEAYPKHTGRFTGEPAYFKHIQESVRQLLTGVKKEIKDFDHLVFHMPNAKFPSQLAKRLKLNLKQFEAGLTVGWIGNPYSASSLVGLARVLGRSQKGDQILMASYGSGSGSDVFWISKTKNAAKTESIRMQKQLEQNIPLSYTAYLRKMDILTK